MKKLLKLEIGFCCLIALLILSACKNPANDGIIETSTTGASTTSTTSVPTTNLYEKGVHWDVYEHKGGLQSISIKNLKGEEFYNDWFDWSGEVEQISETLFQIRASGGNDLYSVQYFDVEQGLISQRYWKPFHIGRGLVAYSGHYVEEEDNETLVIHDMFDPEKNRAVFERKNMLWGGEFLAQKADYIHFPFTKAEFIDDNHLHVIYLTMERTANGEVKEEFVDEILELK